MPDRRQQVAQGVLVDVLDRAISDLGNDMDGERGQPAPGRASAFELGLARFETAGDRLGDRQARDHPVLLAAGFDRALPGAQGGAGRGGSGIGHGNIGPRPKSHFAAAALEEVAQHPLAPGPFTLVQPQARTVTIAAGWRIARGDVREDVLLYRSFPQRGEKGWFQSPVCPPVLRALGGYTMGCGEARNGCFQPFGDFVSSPARGAGAVEKTRTNG